VHKRLNVATKPFTNRALPWVVTVVLALFSFVALAFVVRSTGEANAKADIVQREISSLKQQQLAIQKQVEQVKEAMTPEQLQSLKSAHDLVNRKRFSWSRLFADLEGVLPGGVRVSRIAVRQVRTQGGRTVADLELAVVAKSYSIVTDTMATMNQQGVFLPELRTQNLQKGKGEGGSEYELRVQYTPRSGYAAPSVQPARAAVERPVVEVPVPGGLR
jgi:Tfp pilus assembly protein PilN